MPSSLQLAAPGEPARRPDAPASRLTSFSALARQPRYGFGPRPRQPGADDARIDCAGSPDTATRSEAARAAATPAGAGAAVAAGGPELVVVAGLGAAREPLA